MVPAQRDRLAPHLRPIMDDPGTRHCSRVPEPRAELRLRKHTPRDVRARHHDEPVCGPTQRGLPTRRVLTSPRRRVHGRGNHPYPISGPHLLGTIRGPCVAVPGQCALDEWIDYSEPFRCEPQGRPVY